MYLFFSSKFCNNVFSNFVLAPHVVVPLWFTKITIQYKGLQVFFAHFFVSCIWYFVLLLCNFWFPPAMIKIDWTLFYTDTERHVQLCRRLHWYFAEGVFTMRCLSVTGRRCRVPWTRMTPQRWSRCWALGDAVSRAFTRPSWSARVAGWRSAFARCCDMALNATTLTPSPIPLSYLLLRGAMLTSLTYFWRITARSTGRCWLICGSENKSIL